MGTFSQAGILQFTPRWVDGNFSWTRATAHQLNFANGTGTDQADAFAESTLSVAAGATSTLSVYQAPFTPFDNSANGLIAFQKVKFLSLVNESLTSDLTIAPADAGDDPWTQLGGAVPLQRGGVFVLSAPAAGLPVTASSSAIKITNNDTVYSLAGNTTSGSANVTGISSTTNIKVGMLVTGTGIPANTTVLSITSATAVVLTANATATGTAVALTWRYPPAVVRYHIVGIQY